MGKHSLTSWSLWVDEDCRRLDGAVGAARPSLTANQKAQAQYLRQCLSVGSVHEVKGAADDAPPVLFLVLSLSGSGVRAPATGWPGGSDDIKLPYNVTAIAGVAP